MTIAFIHPHKAFLPEIDAYIDFFSTYQIKTIVARPEETGRTSADVEWHFMGTDMTKRKTGNIKIHEYASASLPPFRKIKDFIKKQLNTRPDFRLFLNKYVSGQFNYKDTVPFGFRDMGVYIDNRSGPESQYDFIYCGSVGKDMHIDKLLRCFTKNDLSNQKLLVLSKDYAHYKQRYQRNTNISFKGPVDKHDVAGYIRSAKFAINYKPDFAPHNHQTSTKLLEYAACRVPVVTSDFPWMRHFQKKYGGNYFYLQKDFSNFNLEDVRRYEYAFPDLKEWSWENQIRRSGILQFLQSKFPDIPF